MMQWLQSMVRRCLWWLHCLRCRWWTHGARDQVGSHILMCVRYTLMALCALVVLTVMLGTYAMAVRVFGTDGTSLVTVVTFEA